MANSTFRWFPTNLTELTSNLKCDSVASWVVNEDLPAFLTAQMFNESLYNFWRTQNFTYKISNRANLTAAYWSSPRRAEINDAIYDVADKNCTTELCKSLGWQGNQDLAGRGMLFNYFIQAALVMIFVIVLIGHRLDRAPPLLSQNRLLKKSIDGILESLRIFLDAAMLFSTVMVVASISTLGKAFFIKSQALTRYSAITSVYMSLWSLYPAIALYCSGKDHLRRRRFRGLCWVFIAVLTVAMMVLFLVFVRDRPYPNFEDVETYGNKELNQAMDALSWEEYCQVKDLDDIFEILVSVVFGATGVHILFWGLIIRNCLRIPLLKRHRVKALDWLRDYWWLFTALLSFVAMWVMLGLFMWFRHVVSDEKITGALNKDHEWSFGQILALATWAPVLVDWGFVFRKGAVKGLTEQHSSRFEVVPSTSLPKTAMVKDTSTSYHGLWNGTSEETVH